MKKKERNTLKAVALKLHSLKKKKNERIIYIIVGGMQNKAAFKGQCIALEK